MRRRIASRLVMTAYEQGKAAKEVWFYEILPPAGHKKYNKTNPMQYDVFAACIEWWNKRAENENTWQFSIAGILEKEKQIVYLLDEIKQLVQP
ncbi:MAG: hypothetical protein IPJ00_19280 [Saprospirales bacterium]|nr:hypothetical protein [Saprospirales bacterium]